MKKILIPISVLFAAGLSQAQLTHTENYVYSTTYLDYNGTIATKTSETVQYIDGLGRPKQFVNVKASPLGRDVVTHIEYDGFGRQVKDYLPVPQSGTMNGAIVPNPLVNATQPTLYGSDKIYAENFPESSPLNRVLKQKHVGNAWNDNPVKFEYDANSVADAVKKYTTITTWLDGATNSVLTQTANYAASQLYKNTVIDEDLNKTIEFKNGEGQTLLVRKNDGVQDVDTYYVYNEYNQLAFVIPPLVSNSALSSTSLNNLCYQYHYDRRNRLVEKKLPGKGWEHMVYDKADRLIMTQDANLRPDKRWLFTKYDKFSRAIYTGITADPNGRSIIQGYVDYNFPNNNEGSGSFTQNGLTVQYSNSNAFPTYIYQLLSVNYYDTYPAGSPAIPTLILEQEVLSQDAQNSNISTKSLPVASYVKNIEDDNWTKNYTWYDKKGRTIGTYSINHLGGFTKTESKLDFAGVPQKTNTYHLRKQGEFGITLKERFVYDNQNRLLQHYHQVDNKPEELLVENQYNELSQLKNKKVGNNLQSIDYAYNIRGWMTEINKDQMNLADLGGKLFSYKIKYEQRDGIENPDTTQFAGKNVTKKYNGNIAETDWRSVETLGVNPPITPKRYGYAYDKLNRLTAGYYQNPLNPYSKENTESLSYDLNGNILGLYRTSVLEYGNTSATLIDNLEYIYSGGDNKVTHINDYAYNDTGYEGGGNTIGYDVNGNMTGMPDKGISLITYNYLNLPNQLKMQASFENVTIKTKYRADGTKLRKENTTITSGFNGDTTQIKTSDYLDGFQYLQSVNQTSVVLQPEIMSRRAMEPQAFTIAQPRTVLTIKT
ncbi:MAG: RHS repeat-associated core domain-containing protein, partial [Chryseobacterium sp.]